MAAVEQKKTAPNTEASSQNSGKQPTSRENSKDNNKENGNKENWDKPIMVARNKKGVVKWFSFRNGYGFITVDDDGDDIFVHRSEFIKEGAREVFYHIDVGDQVEFDIINRAKGREAVAVTGPGGIRLPGSPANFNNRRRYRDSEQRGGPRGPRSGNVESDHYEDAPEEPENNHPNGNAKKRNGRGGRRRTASGDGQDENQPQGNAGGENKGGKGGRNRPRKNTGGRGGGRGGGPRGNAEGEQNNSDNQQPQKQQENVAPSN